MTITEMELAKEVTIENEESSDSNEESTDNESSQESEDNFNDEEDDDHSKSDNTESNVNLAWADSISKILRSNKPKGKKTIVLSKAKKITDLKKSKTTGPTEVFEIETKDGEVKKEVVHKEKDKDDTLSVPEHPVRKKRKELPSLRVKPDILERNRERILSKIATRGVVQLFNAVRNQQKDISYKLEEAGPLEAKREKVMKSLDKRAFLDVLMGEKSEIVDDTVKSKIKEDEEDQTWNVLRDDFMMGAKMKDWDKQVEEESEHENENAVMEYE